MRIWPCLVTERTTAAAASYRKDVADQEAQQVSLEAARTDAIR
jgi:hypothetical protein